MEHSESRPKYLQHHFADAEQQAESAKLGMWLVLLTEVLLFGGLFGFYVFFRAWLPDTFIEASKELDIYMGAINTIVLITSSLTMALSIRAMQLGKKKETIIRLVLTFLLAGAFLVVKYFEYSHKIHEGLLPGKLYTFEGIQALNPHIFFSVYFSMTGLHGFHVIVGMIVIGWMIVRVIKNEFSPEYYTPIEMTGLYWHLVDLIWIFLFPLLYLIG